jgi:hypothetical protein
MKMGFEYEGVILDHNNQPVRWSSLHVGTRFKIKAKMDRMDDPLDPCDAYDCLAEVRTDPLENPTSEQITEALKHEIDMATKAYQSVGLNVYWGEMLIPAKLHQEIVKDLVNRPKKYTCTIANGVQTSYSSEGNCFRGGGLHIHVSPISNALVPAWAMLLHERLYGGRLPDDMRSNYRQNLLYRFRQEPPEGYPWRSWSAVGIGEYMSYGVNLYTANNLFAQWADIILRECYYFASMVEHGGAEALKKAEEIADRSVAPRPVANPDPDQPLPL